MFSNTKRSTKSIPAGILAIAALSIFSQGAMAVEIENGSYCLPLNGSESSSFTRTQFGIKNISGAPRWVACPVAKHTSGAGFTPTGILTVTNTGSTGALSCVISNSSANTVTGTSSLSFSSGTTTRTFTAPAGGSSTSSYTIGCVLPPNSIVHGLLWNG